ncbi:MAG TPA: hypothetical protein VFH02_05680 [Jiangellaceae bacterium]|nr:hypothetical protein [Jiangellaceae bacterium]
MLTRRLAAAAVALLVVAGCSTGGRMPTAVPQSPSTVEESATARTIPACDVPCYGEPESVGMVSPDVAVEVSGIAESHRTPGVYYVVSDSTGTSQVAAVRADGSLVARIEVDGMSARNAEALAIGPCEPGGTQTCLYVGDIGNHVGHEDVFVYRIGEPDLAAPPRNPVPADMLRFTYPGSAPDAEALLVDDAGRPLIVSKAPFDAGVTGMTHLFRGAADGGELEHVGEIDVPEPARPVFAGVVGNGVTDASAADDRVLLRTYDEVIEYRAPEPGVDLASFPGWPVRRVPAPEQIQSEAVTYRPNGCGYLTVSEFTGSVDAVGCRPS